MRSAMVGSSTLTALRQRSTRMASRLRRSVSVSSAAMTCARYLVGLSPKTCR